MRSRAFLQKTVGYIMNKKHAWTTFLTLIAAVVTIVALGSMNVMAAELEEPVEGELGSLTWSIDVDGNLAISGNGEMDFGNSSAPWAPYTGNITTITIEDGVKSIGRAAFAGFPRIKTVTIPDSVTFIGEYAFTASGLESVTLSKNLTFVSGNAFSGSKITSVDIPDGVTNFGPSVFAGNPITSIRFPSDMKKIPSGMFSGARIETLEIPSGVTSIEDSAFYGCQHLKEVVIPKGVTTIGDHAFEGCSALSSVKLSDGLVSIGNYAFQSCLNIKELNIPGSVETIGQYAFYQCSGLKTVSILEGKTSTEIFEYAFMDCTGLKSVSLAASVHQIDSGAFDGCKNIEIVFCFADPENLKWFNSGLNYFKPDKGTICRVPKEYLDDYKAKFASGGTGDVNVTFAADHDDMGLGDLLCGYSLSLEGDIGVKFYMRFNDPDALSDNAKMVFTISSVDGTKKRTQEVYVKQQPDALLPFASKDGEYYVFKCLVYSKEMTSTITAQVTDGEVQGKAYSYTVQDYAKYILLNPGKYPDEQAMIKTMLNYGAASQAYFNYNTQKPANSILDRDDQATQPMSPDDINAGYTEEDISISGTNIRIAKASLILNETISMKLYLTGIDENIVLAYDGTVLTPVKDGEYDVITIDGIKGQYVIFAFNITVRDGNKRLGVLSYSPLYYCKNVLSKETGEVISYNLKNVVSEIVRYGKAAYEYGRKTNQIEI